MAKYKIEFNREACIGCGSCSSICDNWVVEERDKVMKAKPKKAELDEIACNKEAADNCPLQCIKIVEL